MIAYTLNREDRPDRWKLFKDKMLDAGFTDKEVKCQSAYLVEDYENRTHLCEEGAKEFPDFFNFHIGKVWPSYGHIVATWGWLKMLTHVASMQQQLDYALMTPDDYALKRPLSMLLDLIYGLGDVQILQLAYHDSNFVHGHIKEHWERLLPKRVIKYERVGNYPVWKDMCMGASNIYVCSPKGAQLILDYFKQTPLNEEHILYGLAHELAPVGTYSVIENSLEETGLVEMKKNAWIQSLNTQTDGKVSDLIDYYLVSNADYHCKPKVKEKDGHGI